MELFIVFLAICALVGFICIAIAAAAFVVAFCESAWDTYCDWKFNRACRLHAKKMAESPSEPEGGK
jgi:hypothetical protein